MISTSTTSDLSQHQALLTSLTKRLEGLEAELSRASAAYRQSQVEAVTGPREVCASLPRDAALIELFPPEVQAPLAGMPRLFISPDGTLTLLPFGLLPGEHGHEFLLETRAISYVPSGRDLLRAAPPSSAPTGLLALGTPAFDPSPVQVAQAASQRAGCGTPEDPFYPLPGTGAEVRAITRAYQQSNPTGPLTVLEGAQATKAALVGQAPKAKVLHLATHAYFAGEDCTPAGLVSEQRRPGGEPRAFLGHNPLLLAGIALTGANEREKGDGILTALEVTALWEKGLSVPAALRAAQLIPYVGGALDTLLAGRASEIWKRLLERSKRRSVAFTLAC